MNLYSFLNYGAAHALTDSQRRQAVINKAAEDTRKQWLNALLVDETRAWMSVGQSDLGLIEGYTTMLTIAGFAAVHDTREIDSLDVRIIRGAISAATQCVDAGCVVTADAARAMSAAATRAKDIITRASAGAIIHAAQEIRAVVGMS